MKRLIAAAALSVVMLAAPAGAQQYPPPVNSLTISDSTPTPGQVVQLEGRTFASGAPVDVTLTSVPVLLGTATADAAGVMALDATIPADTTLGAHTITAVGQAPDGSELSLSVSINVVAADAADPGTGGGATTPLPRTGDDSSVPLAKLGVTLAAVGGVITAVATKRRKRAAATV